MELSDHLPNGILGQALQRREIMSSFHDDEKESADQIERSLVSQMSQEEMSTRYESGRHVVGYCFAGAAVNESLLASLIGKDLPPKKRKLYFQLQIVEEVADSDDPTQDSKLDVTIIYKDKSNGVISQLKESITYVPDSHSETPDFTGKRLCENEMTSKLTHPASMGRPRSRRQRKLDRQPDESKEHSKCKAVKTLKRGMTGGMKDESSSSYNRLSEMEKRGRPTKGYAQT